jgi:hypothetical protein
MFGVIKISKISVHKKRGAVKTPPIVVESVVSEYQFLILLCNGLR